MGLINRKQHFYLEILFIMVLIHISYGYSDLIVDYFYTKTFIGCRPTFYHPFWDYGRATLASLVSTVFLYIFYQG